MTNQNKTDIGLIGLAVMGENLALNMESKGWYVSVYNRTVPGVEEGVVDRFMNSRAKGKNIEGFTDIKAFVDSIATPRKIMMMVRAGMDPDRTDGGRFCHQPLFPGPPGNGAGPTGAGKHRPWHGLHRESH